IQIGILFIIWVLFGLVVAILYVSNVFNQIDYIYGNLAWSLLAAIFAFVTWFVLKKNHSQQKRASKYSQQS
ncbi:MAG: hypothetical protein ACLQO7_14160, partial [Candidatus Bathyarchaeia archaeon]